MTPDEMEPGNKYLVRYRIKGIHHVERLMVARFLGTDPQPGRGGEKKYDFSGRSGERHGRDTGDTHAFGTTSLHTLDIKEVTEVAQTVQCYANRKANGRR